jgi:U3 small nucleolar RNA-associated protein 5
MSTKRKAPTKVAQPVVKASAMQPSRVTVNETSATVSASHVSAAGKIDVISISSDESSEADYSSEENDSEAEEEGTQVNADSNANAVKQTRGPAVAAEKKQKQPNGLGDIDQLPSPQADDGADSDGEPTLGDLVQAQGDVDVQANFLQQADENARQPQCQDRMAIQAPSLSSLGTVLAQALRTDDSDLLESCLHTTHIPTIRNTIERLESGLVGTLLSKLAMRLHRRPGRAGSLMTWVQWSIIAHGGALVSQPDVMEKLEALQKVLAERARGLNSLLILKGKLDLLDAQMQLRKRTQRRLGDEEEEDNEVGLIYVEGEDGLTARPMRRTVEADEADDGMLPVTNGVIGDSDDEESDEASEEESADGEELDDEDEVNYDDVDDVNESMGEDEDSEDDDAPPSKIQKVASPFSKQR